MSFLDFQNQVNANRADSEKKRGDLKKARQKAGNIKRRKKQLLREISADAHDNDKRLAAINQSEIEFARSVKTGKAAYTQALQKEWATLELFSPFTNPIENIASLPDHCPILLFPLRLETRFKKVDLDGAPVDQLWVRVFPDDIVINSFESDLSATEIRNAQSYWLTRWKVGKNDVDGNRGAWRSLAASHGPGRAYWIINDSGYIPTNLAEEPEKGDGEIILAIGTEKALAEPKLGAIIAYWRDVWQADKDSERLIAAWNFLVERFDEERAIALVQDYKPSNFNEPPPDGLTRDETSVRVEFVIFPSADELETKLHAWSQPPTATILPERFVFLAYHQNGEEAIEPQFGNLVPPELILGPDPAAERGEDFRLASREEAEGDPDLHEGDLIFSQNMRWMFDFDEAVAKGMGFKIDLTPEQVANGFDRVFVLGLKLSADKEKGQVLLEELFAQHQNSRKGLAIIKQGTPTNNTEDSNAGYSWRHDPDDSFDIYFNESDDPKPDPTDWFSKRDGRWLAEMLGIDPLHLKTVENYYGTDIAEGKAIQRALWPATMGHFMESMMNPVFSADTIEQTRDFFTRYISGRGNLPAIRVGKQPYGILPAANYRGMGWFIRPSRTHTSLTTEIIDSRRNFLVGLYAILLEIDKTWAKQQSKVAHVGEKGDSHQILLDIVGLHPDSVELYKRYANSLKQIHNIYKVSGFMSAGLFGRGKNQQLTVDMKNYAKAAALLAKFGYVINAENPAPDIFKKSFFTKAGLLQGDRIDKVPNSEINPISIYTPGENGKNYIGWLIEAARESHDRLRKQDGFIDDKPPTALLYLLLYHALDLSYIDASLKLHLSHQLLTPSQVQAAYIEPDFIHIEQENETESRWKYLYKSDETITGEPELMLGHYIPMHLDTLDEAAAFRDVLTALELLENVPTAALERLLMEHIDTVSYRYDAWLLGFLHLQLEQMRGLHAVDAYTPPRYGVYIGAYGWLEDVRPENKVLAPVTLPDNLGEVLNPDGNLVRDTSNAGYILAPSQNHAVTAAVLRNGHLSTEDPEDKEALKIKLSSERVRLALQIIEGIQGGQTLSALLGYQFERGLHDHTDAEMNAFIFELRNAFPLVAKRFKDTAPGAEDIEYESIEQIEARNVLDGVSLLEHIEETGNRNYPFGLSLPPTDNDTQQNAIDQEILRLIEINDAVADLALAESVHQVVLGNYERAAATLDTYSKGNFPPTPDVIKTPRSGTTLTHRVALQFNTEDHGYTLGNAGVTPRVVAEPAVHHWLAQIMPGMADIVCVVTFFDWTANAVKETQITLEAAGLAHIDMLYLLNIDNEQAMSALDDLIMHTILNHPDHNPRIDTAITIDYTRKTDDDKFTIFEISSLIASLRALLLRSKPLNAADVKLANEAAKEHENTLTLAPERMRPVIDTLEAIIDPDPPKGKLTKYIEDLTALIATENTDDIVAKIDNLMNDIAEIFIEVSAFGLPQTGIGFVYQWRQSMVSQLRGKVEELITRWDDRLSQNTLLIDGYLAEVGSLSDEDLFAILRMAELKISSTSTAHLFDDPAVYFNYINETQLAAFKDMLNNTLLAILGPHSLTTFIQAIQAADIRPFDITPLDIDEQLKQVGIFAGDLRSRAEDLNREIQNRVTKADALLGDVVGTADPLAKVELIKQAAQTIFGEDFVIVPQFALDATQGTEWKNTLTDSAHSLRYLLTELDKDFPMDDWLYGISRVREKMYHVENTLLHIEGFTGATLNLTPSQFPYRKDDFWLGMQFPDKKPGTEDPFTIDEEKLLFTSIYTEAFDPDKLQCGLLLDEWTEVIPSRDETLGLTFHYDQPNSEPPQTLLLVTPSNFTGSWRWEDLVNTLHETLELAKKRAVEPDHIDMTEYGRFLPPIVSLTSPFPLTATLNLALNNLVYYAKEINNE